MKFNEEQIKAISHKDGPCLVSAHPGSGKTSVLTERVYKLVSSGVPQNNLLCITFTNKAAKEMKERICKKLGVNKVSFYIGTFHSLCANILRKYGERVGYKYNFNILDESEQESIIKKIIRAMGKDVKNDEINVPYIIQVINNGRENRNIEEEISERFQNDQLLIDIAHNYLKTIKEENVIDFSGLLYEVDNLLTNNKDILEILQDNFRYILVDEVQDTNFIQFRIINMLGEKYKNIFIVGDLNQSIYAFRGARYQNIIDFISNNPNCVKIELPENYRSTPEIVKISSNLISKNKSNISGPMRTSNPSGQEVICKQCYDSTEEAFWISDKIRYFVNELGWDYSDIFILYRLNSISLEIQTALAKNRIPFIVIGGHSFFDRLEIKDCLSMLKFASNPNDSSAFHRVSTLLPRVGDKTVAEIERIYRDRKMDFLSICKDIDQFTEKNAVKNLAKKIIDIYNFDYSNMSVGDILDNLVKRFEYEKYLENSSLKDIQDRLDNIQELINNATGFSNEGGSLDKYLQNISLISSSDKENDGNAVTLCTIHAAKGLEAGIVFAPSVNQDILPHARAIAESDPEFAIEEERRLCFVCMTRAKKHLFISYCNNRKFRDNRGQLVYRPSKPSQFLKDVGLIK